MPKENADLAMDAAACIGCGACVAACPNASAMLFTAAKVSHLALLPQGQPERESARAARWSRRWTRKASAAAPIIGECEAVCPKEISVDFIARMNREYFRAALVSGRRAAGAGEGAGG